MQLCIQVEFRGLVPNPSLESATHRWVARLEASGIEVLRACAIIESSRRHTIVQLVLTPGDGTGVTAVVEHADPYVAISEAFRIARKQILGSMRIPSLAYA